jgi:hypothetical protein
MVSNPKPKISDGIVAILGIVVIGAPTVFGPYIADWLGYAMFYGGIGAIFLFVLFRWGAWIFGIAKSENSPGAGLDNKGGIYVGHDNSGPQTIYNAPVTIHHAQPRPVIPSRVFVGESITADYLLGLFHVPGRTSSQATKDIEPFKGKWMPISGSMKDVSWSEGREFAHMVFEQDREKSIDHTNPLYWVSIYLIFRKDWIAQALILRPNDRIKVIGQIERVDATSLQLENCELVNTVAE